MSLQPAIAHKTELEKIWPSVAMLHTNRFAAGIGDWANLTLTLDENTWSNIQLVSVDGDGKIRGYISASMNRGSERVDEIFLINVDGKPSLTFSRDLQRFIGLLFYRYKLRSISWSCVSENEHAMRFYMKFVKKYGARVVGERHGTAKIDGQWCNKTLFEMQRVDFIKALGIIGGRRMEKIVEKMP